MNPQNIKAVGILRALAASTTNATSAAGPGAADRAAGKPRPEGSGVLSRTFTSRAQLWEQLALPSRKGQFDATAVVSRMLPGRAAFVAQFTPHGLQLIPRSTIVAAPSAAPAAAPPKSEAVAAASAARERAALAKAPVREREEEYEEEDSMQGVVMQMADKTLVWRKLKMRKHKIKKRRLANRYKSK